MYYEFINGVNKMRLQFTIDETLGHQLQAKSHNLGLSVSSYIRHLVKKSLENKTSKIEMALAEIERGEVETLTLDEFKKQIESLK